MLLSISCEAESSTSKELRVLLQELKEIVLDDYSTPPVTTVDSLCVSNVLDQPPHNQLSVIMHKLNQLIIHS